MADEKQRSAAARLLSAHPELRRTMVESKIFPRIRHQAGLPIDGEQLYIVMGDTLGTEEDLYLEALIRGAAGQGDLNRALFNELDGRLRSVVMDASAKE
jgi:hypothetical protein